MARDQLQYFGNVSEDIHARTKLSKYLNHNRVSQNKSPFLNFCVLYSFQDSSHTTMIVYSSTESFINNIQTKKKTLCEKIVENYGYDFKLNGTKQLWHIHKP